MCAKQLMQTMVEKFHRISRVCLRCQKCVPFEILQFPIDWLQVGVSEIIELAAENVIDKTIELFRSWLEAKQRLETVIRC